jgi:hypothetical protein
VKGPGSFIEEEAIDEDGIIGKKSYSSNMIIMQQWLNFYHQIMLHCLTAIYYCSNKKISLFLD